MSEFRIQPPPPSDEQPEMHDAHIDGAVLEQLFADVAQCAELHEILVKGGTQSRAQGGASMTLEETRDAILGGALRAVQLRYTFEGSQWWDTITALPKGYRLVRIRHNF